MNTSGHLRPESIFGYEHQLLLPEELRAVHEHIATCAECRTKLAGQMGLDGTVDDVRARLAVAPTHAHNFLRYAAAAAILVVSAGAIWFLRQNSVGLVEPESVRQALLAGSIPLPSFLSGLAPADQVLMGGPTALGPRLISPKATGVLGPRVDFRWRAIEGTWTYRLRLFALDGTPVAASPEISETHWTCDRELTPGSDYQWQVTATRGAERLTLPPPSETPPKFRVVDSATSERLRELARLQPGAHLLLGVEYAKAGLLDDARTELSEASRLDSRRTQILALIRSLGSQ